MVLSTILKEKAANKIKLLKENNFIDEKNPIWFIDVNSKIIDNILIDALKILPANFVIYSNDNSFENSDNIVFIKNLDTNINSWFDFIVSNNEDTDILKNMKLSTVPIISWNNKIFSLLKEFNAANVEWNSFIFKNEVLCDIYYAIIRYLENYKFPYDNKALVKNVLDI